MGAESRTEVAICRECHAAIQWTPARKQRRIALACPRCGKTGMMMAASWFLPRQFRGRFRIWCTGALDATARNDYDTGLLKDDDDQRAYDAGYALSKSHIGARRKRWDERPKPSLKVILPVVCSRCGCEAPAHLAWRIDRRTLCGPCRDAWLENQAETAMCAAG